MKVLLSLFVLFTTQFQGPPVEIDNVPFTISACLQPESNRFEVSRRMNPFYLRGDFNGDGKLSSEAEVLRYNTDYENRYQICRAHNR